jgi:hypothetical protein
MSTGIARTTANALVTANLSGGGSIRPWVHPTTVAGTDGWSKQAATGSTAALYDVTRPRRVLARDGTSDDVSTGVEYSYRATDSSSLSGSTAVAWGQPIKSGTASLVVVFAPSSL